MDRRHQGCDELRVAKAAVQFLWLRDELQQLPTKRPPHPDTPGTWEAMMDISSISISLPLASSGLYFLVAT